MLLLLNLKTLVCKLPLYFIMLCLVLFTTISGTIITLNFFVSIQNQHAVYRDNERAYSIGGEYASIDALLAEFTALRQQDLQRIYGVFTNGEDRIAVNYYGKSSLKYKVQFGTYLDDSSKKQIIIPINTPNGSDLIGQTYSIGGDVYDIVGVSSGEMYEISYLSLTDKTKIETIVFVANRTLKDISGFVGDIKTIFSPETVAMPAVSAGGGLGSDYIFIIGIILLGVLNFAFVFAGLLEKRKPQQAILYLLGCRKTKMMLLYALEIYVVVTTVFVCCCLLCKFLLFDLLHTFDPFFIHALTLEQYLIIYLMYVSMILWIVVYQLLRWGRKTPFEMKRK